MWRPPQKDLMTEARCLTRENRPVSASVCLLCPLLALVRKDRFRICQRRHLQISRAGRGLGMKHTGARTPEPARGMQSLTQPTHPCRPQNGPLWDVLPDGTYLLSSGSEGSPGCNHLIQCDPQGKVVYREVIFFTTEELRGHETCHQEHMEI